MIVKVQRSINPRDKTIFVYDESGDVWWEGPMTNEHKQLLGDDLKAYFEAEIIHTKLHLGARVKKQDW